MDINKLNGLFSRKEIIPNPSKKNVKDFFENYLEGGFLAPQTRPTRISILGTGPNSELWVSEDVLNSDILRTKLGSNWETDRDSLSLAKYQAGNTPLVSVAAFDVGSNLPPSTSNFGGTRENLLVTGPDSDISIINQNLPSVTISDLVFDLPTTEIAAASSYYNFYIKEYEDATSTTGFNELNLLDSFGTYLSIDSLWPVIQDGTGPEEINKAIVKYGSSGSPLAESFELSSPSTEKGFPNNNVKNFYRSYAVEIKSQIPSQKYKNVIYPNRRTVEANMATSRNKDMFPYYIGFDVNMASDGSLSKAFEDTGLANLFMKNVAASIDSGNGYRRQTFIRNTQNGNYRANPRTWNMSYLLGERGGDFRERCVILGTNRDVREAFPSEETNFYSYINDIQALESLYNAVSQNWRTYDNLTNGAKAYSEVLMYRVAKYKRGSQNPIQNFFFFNSSDASLFKFMDTQVKVGEEYIYKVFSYTGVIGNNYKYETVRGTSSTENSGVSMAAIQINNKASFKVVENIVFSTQSYVVSCPPIYPDVGFTSFIGEERKIQISLSDRPGVLNQVPFSLSQEEVARMDKIRKAQGASTDVGCPDCISFKNDDVTKVYEIYRTTAPPTSLRSFQGNLSRRITNSNVVESVIPDTTYYYMFRSIDAHGNVSNPSKTYEVTLIGGFSPYLIVRDYNYQDSLPEQKKKIRKMKRFMRLRPALPHLFMKEGPLLDKSSSKDINAGNVIMGVAPEGAIWNKKFKIRLTSIESGKKIDFNIDYNYNFEDREE
jgi:hypothetical protein